MEQYASWLQIAIDIAHIDLLVAFWKETVWTAELGQAVRAQITTALPVIAKKNNLPYNEQTFPDFVQTVYDVEILKDILTHKHYLLSGYVKAGGYLRAQAVVNALLKLTRPAFKDEYFALELGKALYWIFVRGKKPIVSNFLRKLRKRIPSSTRVESVWEGFLNQVEDMHIIQKLLAVLVEINDDDYFSVVFFGQAMEEWQLIIPYWKHFVEKCLEKGEARILNDYLFEKEIIPSTSFQEAIAILITHPAYTIRQKAELAQILFSGSPLVDFGPNLLDMPYDYTFHHCLLHYLQKAYIKTNKTVASIIRSLVEKHGRDVSFDFYFWKREKEALAMNRLLSEPEPLFDLEDEENDDSYVYQSESSEECSSEEEELQWSSDDVRWDEWDATVDSDQDWSGW